MVHRNHKMKTMIWWRQLVNTYVYYRKAACLKSVYCMKCYLKSILTNYCFWWVLNDWRIFISQPYMMFIVIFDLLFPGQNNQKLIMRWAYEKNITLIPEHLRCVCRLDPRQGPVKPEVLPIQWSGRRSNRRLQRNNSLSPNSPLLNLVNSGDYYEEKGTYAHPEGMQLTADLERS